MVERGGKGEDWQGVSDGGRGKIGREGAMVEKRKRG